MNHSLHSALLTSYKERP